jgi:hypothetical protein
MVPPRNQKRFLYAPNLLSEALEQIMCAAAEFCIEQEASDPAQHFSSI